MDKYEKQVRYIQNKRFILDKLRTSSKILLVDPGDDPFNKAGGLTSQHIASGVAGNLKKYFRDEFIIKLTKIPNNFFSHTDFISREIQSDEEENHYMTYSGDFYETEVYLTYCNIEIQLDDGYKTRVLFKVNVSTCIPRFLNSDKVFSYAYYVYEDTERFIQNYKEILDREKEANKKPSIFSRLFNRKKDNGPQLSSPDPIVKKRATRKRKIVRREL